MCTLGVEPPERKTCIRNYERYYEVSFGETVDSTFNLDLLIDLAMHAFSRTMTM